MKKTVLSSGFMLFLIFALSAQQATVVYTEGSVYVKDHKGASWDPDIGSQLVYNDTVLTGYNGFTELDTGSSTITIHSNSVFKFMQAGKGGEKQTVFSCMLGSVYLKVQKITGQGPRITSGSMAAGVRGTEFFVYSGVDGSSLIHVTKGIVEVESEGRKVSLNADEAVEIKLGRPPGEKVNMLGRPVDYSKWNQERFDEFIKDPIGTLTRLEKRMNEYIKQFYDLLKDYERNLILLANERKKLDDLYKINKEEADIYFTDVVNPISLNTKNQFLNLRYYILSSISLRRYILGRLYMFMKLDYIEDLTNKKYISFISYYDRIIRNMNDKIFNPDLVKKYLVSDADL